MSTEMKKNTYIAAPACARRVACLIINWNGTTDTLELLASLARQGKEKVRLDVFIVDNASEAEQLSILKEGLTHVKGLGSAVLIENRRNVGVPAAYNQAIAMAGRDYDYYLRLDNDVIILDEALQAMIEGMERNREEGVRLVGGNIRYYDRPKEDNGGACRFDLVLGRTSIEYPNQDTLCDGVLGCVMLIDREVISAFSPSVFLGWLFLTTDESELSLRCAEMGWKTLYVARTIALHKSGRSTCKVKSLSTLYSCRNWSYMALRYARPRWRKVVVGFRLIATMTYLALKGQMWRVKAIALGVVAAIRGLKRAG
jgi:GT2 family glycosyltransferase